MGVKSLAFFRNKYWIMCAVGFASLLVNTVAQMVDGIIAGQFFGESAVAAISVISPIFAVITFFSSMVSIGTSSMYSVEIGRFNNTIAYRYFGQAIILSVIMGIILAIVSFASRDYFIDFFDCTETVRNFASEYYRYYPLGIVVQPLFLLFHALIFNDGNARIVGIADVTVCVVNVMASLLLMGKMGIAGLGLGTSIGTIVGFLVLITHFFRKKNKLKAIPSFSIHTFLRILLSSAGNAVITLFVAVVDIVLNKAIIVWYGDSYLAAYTIVNTLLNFACCYMCFGLAYEPFAAVYYGEQNPKAINKSVKYLLKFVIITGVIGTLIVECLPKAMTVMYGITTPEVLEASLLTTKIIGSTMLPTAVVLFFIGYYGSRETDVEAFIISMLYMLVGPLVLGLPLGYFFGFNGISIAMMLTPIFSIILGFLIVGIRNGFGLMPFIIEPTDEKSFLFDLSVTQENVMKLQSEVAQELEEYGVEANICFKVQLVIEEVYMLIIEKNPGYTPISEFWIMVNDDHVRIMMRDTGKIFNVTDTDASIKSMRCFVVACMMEQMNKRRNLTTISCNRNSFYFERMNGEQEVADFHK